MAEAIFENAQYIIEENKKDMVLGEKNRLISSLLDRLLLNKSRITAMAKSLVEISALKEPVG